MHVLSTRRLVPLLVVAALVLLAGCGRGAREEPTPTPTSPVAPISDEPVVQVASPEVSTISQGTTPSALPASTPTAPVPMAGTLVLWHSWAGQDGEALAQILARFQDRYPELTLETLFVGYSRLAQGYASAVSAGGGPDLLLGPNWWLEDLVAAEALAPLEGQVSPDLLEAYLPAAVENLRYQGRLYGLPTNVELVALYVNRGLLGDRPVPATTEELLAYAQEDPRLGIGLYANLYHLSWGFAAYGATFFDAQGRLVLDQGDGAARFLEWLRRAQETPGIFVSPDYGMLIDRFKKGEFAFFVDGPWSRAELTEALGADLAVARLPAGPAGPARPWLSADGAFLNPNSTPEQAARALALARHVTSPESGSVWAQTAGRIPAQVEADVGTDALVQGFLDQARQALPEPNRPEMVAVYTYMGDMVLKVLGGAASPEQAVVEAVTLVQEEMGR